MRPARAGHTWHVRLGPAHRPRGEITARPIRAGHSIERLAALTTLAHFSVSSATSLPNSRRRHRHRLAAEIGHALLDLRIGQRRVERLVQHLHDLRRDALRARRRRRTRSPRSPARSRRRPARRAARRCASPWSRRARAACRSSRTPSSPADCRTATCDLAGHQIGIDAGRAAIGHVHACRAWSSS